MAIGNLFGSGGESNSLYGTSLTSGGSIPAASSFIYFEWFIFKVSSSQPATPTGGSWDFLTNTGTAPTGWVSNYSGIPLDNMWFSIAFVDSRNPTGFTWSTPGLISATTSVYASAYADKFTGNGSTTAWTLSADPVTVQNLDVSVNGVTQTPTTDYTISGTTFTTTTASPLGSIILVKYRQALPNSYYGLASNVGFTPSGWIASTNVQTALAEVATDIAATDGVSGSNLIGYKPAGTGAVATTVQAKLRQTVSVLDFGAKGDGTTDDYAAIQAAIIATQGKGKVLVFPQANYVISSALLVTAPITIDGQMAQIYQKTTNTNAFVFDKGVSGSSNYQYVFNVQNLVVATIAGTGNAFIFRNINESTFKNLYVPGVGAIAFYFQGCLLNLVEHCYTGDGLTASPGFFITGLPTNKYGFITEDYNSLGSNSNVFERCTATNSSFTAFQIAGNGNTLINCDAEGISSGSTHVALTGPSNVIGGDFEGTGSGIVITASNCTIQGINSGTFVEVSTGVKGTDIRGGYSKYIVFDSGSSYNSVQNLMIGAGGSLVDNGTNNVKQNITSSTGTQLGDYLTGTFTPLLKFGGGNTSMTYYNNVGSYRRSGNTVFVQLWVYVNVLGSSTGAATIDLNDLPFTSANIGSGRTVQLSAISNLVIVGAGYGNVIPVLDNNSKTIEIQAVSATTGLSTNLANTAFANGSQIQISGTFAV